MASWFDDPCFDHEAETVGAYTLTGDAWRRLQSLRERGVACSRVIAVAGVTDKETADKIVVQGFNRSFCGKNATVYGQGVYFARDASYSCQTKYARRDKAGVQRVFLARVVIGEYCKGDSSMIVPKPRHGNVLFDATVDDTGNPSIFVTYHDDQACPDYLIELKQ